MAECHPVGFQWVMEAKARGATILHVDPRFSRTSALADVHVPLRAGTDIAFLGGLIHYVLEHDRWFRDYVVHYTNAPMILREDFRDTEDLDGLFSGFDAEGRHYDQSTWQYEGAEVAAAAGLRDQWATMQRDAPGGDAHGERMRDSSSTETAGSGGGTFHGMPHRDDTLQHPRCVFQLLKRHFARYTPATVADICGISEREFLRIAEIVTRNSGPDRTTAIAYAVGWTHHTVGVQYIRTASILQLLLGNIGRPGGGILALRGHASIQGSTDIPTLFNILPGYLPMPHAHEHLDLREYISSGAGSTGFWGNLDTYIVSLLKAWWGEAATAENDFCFGYLPRLTSGHSNYDTVVKQADGGAEGYFLVGENPAVGTANSRMNRIGLANLKWLVVRDLYMVESATFWKDGPEIESGELTTEDIGTEVFFLPAAAHVEKDGTFTNTQRLLQWHHKAVEPRGDQRSELWFYYHLGRRIREKLAAEDRGTPAPGEAERDRAVLDLTWDYPTIGPHAEPDAEAVLAEINGWDGDGAPLSAFTALKADGSTRCGCWIYCGAFADGVNQTARRRPGGEQNWVAPEWGWAWPANRRLLYNRASADPDGRPWSERKAYVWWDADQEKWVGHDVPDFEATKRPDYQPPEGAERQDALAGTDPFIMQADGRGWLYVPAGLADGPLPAHYEPAESPVGNPLYGQQANPARRVFPHRLNRYAPSDGTPGADVFPYVFTTYRLTEHHTAGGMSRWLPYLSELQPEMFCEVSPALAAERGLEHMGWATIVSARAAIEARVLVTERMRPLRVGGRTIHQIGLPYHWGPNGISTGDAANELLPIILDPNVHIQPTKADTCDIRPGRRPRGPARLALVETYQRRAGITERTGMAATTTDATTRDATTDGGRRG